MKAPFIYRGEPEEREKHYRCIAYQANGRLCKKPAIYLDPARGWFICERHHSERVAQVKAESLQPQAA